MTRITDISTNKVLSVSTGTIIAMLLAVVSYMGEFATKKDVYISAISVSIQLLKLRATDYEYIIASGRDLTPIEQNTYEKITADIERLQKERLKILNE